MSGMPAVVLGFSNEGKLVIKVLKDVIESHHVSDENFRTFRTSALGLPIHILSQLNPEGEGSSRLRISGVVERKLAENVPIQLGFNKEEDGRHLFIRLQQELFEELGGPVSGYYEFEVEANGLPLHFFNGVDPDGDCFALKLKIGV